MERANNTPGELPLDQCDVQDKRSLEKYRELRAKWLEWLQSDPNHPIWSQIVSVIDNDLAVRTIACAVENDPESPLRNPMIARTILGGHRDAQVLGIRRLMDKREDVISLKRLLNEVKDNAALFSREIYVSGAGLPYDPSSASADSSLTAIPSGGLPGTAFVALDSFIGKDHRAKAAHKLFDRLSRTPPSRRARTDRIPACLIDHLETYIKKSGVEDVVKWSHEFLAHAGDARVRGWQNPRVTFDKVASVQRSIVQVVQLVSGQLLQGPHLGTLVPVAQFNRFAGFDRLVSPQALEQARQRWNELEQDRNSWLQNGWGSPDLLTMVGWPDAMVP